MSPPVPIRSFQPIAFVRLLFVVVFLASLPLANPAFAQAPDEAASATVEAASVPATEEETLRPTLELGEFKINDLRPTRNVTAKLTFTLHLTFSKSLSKQQVVRLEHWKHRLRDQVITAVRISQVRDFQEPSLSRLRRRILIRVNRLFQAKLAEEVLLTEYLFRTH